ncbi:MAG: ECF-type sigma factor, partial [Nocardioides sp.]|nr:ECF-type sigma factor [Nocardioides sp.]
PAPPAALGVLSGWAVTPPPPRRRMRKVPTVALADGDDVEHTGGLPTEERSALMAALQQMPEMQRKTVVLRHWLGLSVEETAHELGITGGTVKSHTSRGLETLRATLDLADLD